MVSLRDEAGFMHTYLYQISLGTSMDLHQLLSSRKLGDQFSKCALPLLHLEVPFGLEISSIRMRSLRMNFHDFEGSLHQKHMALPMLNVI